MMNLSGQDIYRTHQPSACDLRLFFHHQNKPASEPGAFDQVIMRLGNRYELAHLATHQQAVDCSQGSLSARAAATTEAIKVGTAVIYQPVFATDFEIDGNRWKITGIPDFLVRMNDQYAIRDVKLARRIEGKSHPEILHQLKFYGWLFEKVVGQQAARLEVLGGKGEIVEIEPASPAEIEALLTKLANIIVGAEPPFEPVGWTKCGSCGYRDTCWKEAETRNDVALVPDVDQGLARALHDAGVLTYDDLLAKFTKEDLAEFKRPWGAKMQRVGPKRATDALLSASALQSGKPIWLATPLIADHPPNVVMFDLEGLPPHLDQLEKIYLWGMQVYGDRPSTFLSSTAGFGEAGDAEGWSGFLKHASAILDDYGDVPFVHWHHYEKTKIKMYIERFGDPDGVAKRVLDKLFDLLPATQAAVALPLPSYSLKVVEQFVGFERTQDEYGGSWAMAQYIEAVETNDEAVRQKNMADILKYNEEDLGATWAVYCWLKKGKQDSN